MLKFMYVKFAPSQQQPDQQPETNHLGLAMSYEPLKWYAILHRKVRHKEYENEMDLEMTNFRSRVQQCWVPGEYPTSLNIELDIDDDDEVPYYKRLMQRLFLGCVEVEEAPDVRIHEEPQTSRILPWRRTHAA